MAATVNVEHWALRSLGDIVPTAAREAAFGALYLKFHQLGELGRGLAAQDIGRAHVEARHLIDGQVDAAAFRALSERRE